MALKWHVEERQIEDLTEYEKNARILKESQAEVLKESLDKFNLCQPIVINTDNTIIGGHQRLRLLKEKGETQVLVSYPSRNLNEKEVAKLNLLLNKSGGIFDYDKLVNEFDVEDLLFAGFTPKDFELTLEKEKKPMKWTARFEFSSEEEFSSFEKDMQTLLEKYPNVKSKFKEPK